MNGQRTREIGVRRALGAAAGSALRSIFVRTGWQIAIGLIAGVVLGWAFAGALTRTLHSIQESDSMVALTVLAMLIFAALVAILVPAPRAWRVHPTEALRHERSAGHE